MSAETLRRAAALMRERATHPDLSDLPWYPSPHGDVHDHGTLWVCDTQCGAAAEHIASWHPAVALAVADLLDSAAEAFGDIEAWRGPGVIETVPVEFHALAVARAYLGETA